MRSKVILTLLLITAGVVNAQMDKVSFKDCSVISGKLLSLNRDSVHVSFNGESKGFGVEGIHRITIRNNMQSGIDRGVLDSLNGANSVKRFDKAVLVGLMGGGGINNSDIYPLINILGSYRFKRFLQVGLGAGYEQYDNYINMPVYLYYRGDLFRHFSGLYYYAGAGYSKMWSKADMKDNVDEVKGGKVFKLGFGFIFDTKSKVDFLASVGWSRQEMEVEHPLYYMWRGEYKSEISRTMDRMEFKIGICF